MQLCCLLHDESLGASILSRLTGHPHDLIDRKLPLPILGEEPSSILIAVNSRLRLTTYTLFVAYLLAALAGNEVPRRD